MLYNKCILFLLEKCFLNVGPWRNTKEATDWTRSMRVRKVKEVTMLPQMGYMLSWGCFHESQSLPYLESPQQGGQADEIRHCGKNPWKNLSCMGRDDGAMWTLAHELVALMKEQQNLGSAHAGKYAEQREHASIAGRSANLATLEIHVAVSQKIGNWSTSRPSCASLGHIPKGCSIIPQGHLHNSVHISIIHIARNLKQSRCSSTKEWIKKVWYIYTTYWYYPVIKNNDILKFPLARNVWGEMAVTLSGSF